LQLAKEIYAEAYARRAELKQPYLAVVSINDANLPAPAEVGSWTSEKFVGTLRHDQSNPLYNPEFRQLVHIGYKVAAQKGQTYLDLLLKYEPTVARNVTVNLFDRHIQPLFFS